MQANRTFTKEAFKNQKLGENRVNVHAFFVSFQKSKGELFGAKIRDFLGEKGVKKYGPTNFIWLSKIIMGGGRVVSFFSTKVQSASTTCAVGGFGAKKRAKNFSITLKLWCESCLYCVWASAQTPTKFKKMVTNRCEVQKKNKLQSWYNIFAYVKNCLGWWDREFSQQKVEYIIFLAHVNKNHHHQQNPIKSSLKKTICHYTGAACKAKIVNRKGEVGWDYYYEK